MARIDWRRAKKTPRATIGDHLAAKRDRQADRILGEPLPKSRALIAEAIEEAILTTFDLPPVRTRPDVRWPVYVTVPDGKGGLCAHAFKTRHDADALGFHWVGRVRHG